MDATTPSDLRSDVERALAGVVDPELGLAITDLGLVRAIDFEDRRCRITLTMTSAACPQGDLIADEAAAAAEAVLPEGTPVEVVFVTDPPWTPDAMSARARAFLGA